VVRSIHDESLVGDRQFWVTRPYDWKKLAAAKILTALLFIHVPLFIAQVAILERSGFRAALHVRELLLVQLQIFWVLDVAAALVAAVTSNIVQILLWLVGVAVFIAGLASLAEAVPNETMPIPGDAPGYLAGAAWVALCAVVLLIQFRRRKVWIARLVIFAAALALVLVIVASPYALLVARAYPELPPGASPPLILRVATHPRAEGSKPYEPGEREKEVSLTFPTSSSVIERNTFALIEGVRVTIESASGETSKSRWHTEDWEFWPGDTEFDVPVSVERRFFDRNRDAPVKVHFSFAMRAYRETGIHEVIARAGEFPVEGVGTCWLEPHRIRGILFRRVDSLSCESAFVEPTVSGRFDTSASTCTPGPREDPNIHESAHLFVQSGSDPDPEIIPVHFFGLYFNGRGIDSSRKFPLGICVGTPVMLSKPKTFLTGRIETEIDGIKLSDFLPRPETPNFDAE